MREKIRIHVTLSNKESLDEIEGNSKGNSLQAQWANHNDTYIVLKQNETNS